MTNCPLFIPCYYVSALLPHDTSRLYNSVSVPWACGCVYPVETYTSLTKISIHYSLMHSIVVHHYSLMVLVNNIMPPKKMQYEIIYQPTTSGYQIYPTQIL